MKRTRVLATAGISLGLVVAMQTGCAQTKAATRPAAEKAEAAAQPAAQPAAAQDTVALSGKVVESISGGSYTYVALEKDGKVSWAAMAVPATVGQELTLKPGVVMKNFTSKALNRTFDAIVFSDGPVGQEGKTPHGMGMGTAATAPAAAPVQAPKLAGKVVETMDAGGYTYLKLENGGETTWAAIPVTKVTVGQEVELQPGMPMDNFTSKTLNRTFDKIAFSSGLATDAKAPAQGAPHSAPAGHPAGAPAAAGKEAAQPQQGGHMSGSHGSMKPGRKDVSISGKVVESLNGGGYSFILLEQDGKKAWAAVPAMKVEQGQELVLEPGTEMLNFSSTRLNREFGTVIFSPGVVRPKK